MTQRYYIVYEKNQPSKLPEKVSFELTLDETDPELLVSKIEDVIYDKFKRERNYGETIPEFVIVNIINLNKLIK